VTDWDSSHFQLVSDDIKSANEKTDTVKNTKVTSRSKRREGKGVTAGFFEEKRNRIWPSRPKLYSREGS
jgi:hypothetical protein